MVGIVVILTIFVVGMLANSTDSSVQISNSADDVVAKSAVISISDVAVDNSGDGIITLANNTGTNIDIIKLSVEGKDLNYFTSMPVGDTKTFLLNDLNAHCVCATPGGNKKCDYSVYVRTPEGLDKRYDYSITVDCVVDTQPKTTPETPDETSAAFAQLRISNLSVTALSDSQINLTWADSCNTEDGYRIERSLNGSTWAEIGTAQRNQQSYLDTGRTEKTLYYYRVKLYRSDVNSLYSNTASITTPMVLHLISTCADVNSIRNFLDGNFSLTNDINCSETRDWNGGLGFEPIGTTSVPFYGIINGNNFKITGLHINRPNTDYVGLFSQLGNWSSPITNINHLYLEDVNILGKAYVGGIAGYKVNNYGTITYSHVTGKVTGTGGYVGGLIGQNNWIIAPISIYKSYFSGSVKGYGQYVGGLVGYNASNISDCYTMGDVNNVYFYGRAGGLIGQNNANVSNSYSTANIFGDPFGSYVGGIVGENSTSSIISNSYALGAVTGSKVGGLVGHNSQTASIINCYATGTVNGAYDRVGGLVGLNASSVTPSISNSYSTGRIICSTSDCGGLVGQLSSGTVSNSYWDINRSGRANCCGSGTCTACIGKNSANSEPDTFYPKAGLGGDYNVPMQHNSSSINDWNFAGIWQISDGNYPLLR
jgi:hypothetical protein